MKLCIRLHVQVVVLGLRVRPLFEKGKGMHQNKAHPQVVMRLLYVYHLV